MDSAKKTDTLVTHLATLRKRLIIILVINLGAAMICYQFMGTLIQYILNLNPGMKLVYLTPSEPFMAYLELALTCAIVLCFPITVLQIWLFVSPGLYKKEQIYVLLSLFFGFFFFIAGVIFSYFIALPVTLDFFMRITVESVTSAVSIKNFVSFCNATLLSFGAVFELPVLVFLLSLLGILKPAFMKKSHGVLILVIFVVAAIITPPDVVSQVLLAIPMIILLEISMGICILVHKYREKRELLEQSNA
ncbi:twin-arginine translocase subunit TatC [Lacrimispora sp.]|uniref:twin-arginine translocase subunit TatC n=1 Tax=Lacrimispora sp. TaxID=2719234 RepID=UPI0034616085